MLVQIDWTNWDENLTSDKVKYLSQKKAAKGQRCRGKTLRLPGRILLVPDLSFCPLLFPKREVLEKIVHLENCWNKESHMFKTVLTSIISHIKHETWQKMIFGTNSAHSLQGCQNFCVSGTLALFPWQDWLAVQLTFVPALTSSHLLLDSCSPAGDILPPPSTYTECEGKPCSFIRC